MPSPNLQMYINNNPVSASNKIDFGEVEKGLASSVIKVMLWNDKDGINNSDTAVNPRLSAVNTPGDASVIFNGTSVNGNTSMLEARSCGAKNVSADRQSSWSKISPSDFLDMGDIPKNAAREIEIRLNIPQDSSNLSSTTVTLRTHV